MNHEPGALHRRSIRLKGYDYAIPGAYFVTICAQNRARLFGDVSGDEPLLNPAGHMVAEAWAQIPAHYPGVDVDAFIVMPNHFHGIILVGADPRVCPDRSQNGQSQGIAPTRSLSLPQVVQRLKALTTKRYIDGVNNSGWPPFERRLWQRDYYERVIRNDRELNAIREYIRANPANWEKDEEYMP